jgi:hypothetical protein
MTNTAKEAGMTDWNALLGLSEYSVTLEGWPRVVPVSASSKESAIAKARSASAATTRDNAWLTAQATVTQA